MKFLIALSAFQAVLIAFFGLRVMEIDARTNKIARIVETDATQTERPRTDSYSLNSSVRNSPTIEDIRHLLREELAALEEGSPLAQKRRLTSERSANNTSPNGGADSAVDTIYLKDTVVRDIDSYINLGRIEPAEMSVLQTKIARLPPSDRQEMLSKLTKAMNAGDLQGEF